MNTANTNQLTANTDKIMQLDSSAQTVVPFQLTDTGSRRKRHISRVTRIGRALLATALSFATLSACTQNQIDKDNDGSTANGSGDQLTVGGPKAIKAEMPAVPVQLKEFYEQTVNWEDCKQGQQCAKIKVPLDYAHPNTKSIEIALKKHPAKKEAIGTLLVNPGGPGGSGQEMIDSANYFFTAPLLENFDIVGFDPRGVGESAPIDCLDDVQLGRVLEASYQDTPEGKALYQEDVKRIADGCKDHSGELLPFVGTKNAARDMDIIRHLSGDPRLYYLGYSYGTSLGGMYAQLFPKNVGRMVLDGAVSSDASNFEQSLAQMKGFEQSLDAYLNDCLSDTKTCPFKGSVAEARTQIEYILKQTLSQPVVETTTGRTLTQSALIFGIVASLYDDQTWAALSKAFTDLQNSHNPRLFLMLFDSYTGRSGDKFLNNSMEANWAINCADYRADGDEANWKEQSAQMAQESPIFGAAMQYDEALCSMWPYQPEGKIGPFTADGSAPIVVVGTTGDPATPYEWAKKFAQTLENGHLVTWEGEGHTAYGHSTPCVDDALNAYLLNGTVPKENLVCPAK